MLQMKMERIILCIVAIIGFLKSSQCFDNYYNCSLDYSLREHYMKYCISDCLDLAENKEKPQLEKSQCIYNPETGHDEICPRKFERAISKKKVVVCAIERATMGAEWISACDFVVLRNIVYFNVIIQAMDFDKVLMKAYKDQLKILKKMGIKVLIQVGSPLKHRLDPERMQQLAHEPQTRERLFHLVLNVLETGGFDGVLFMWLSPGCNYLVRCTPYDIELKKVVDFVTEFGRLLHRRNKMHILYTMTTVDSINFFVGDYFSSVFKFVDYIVMESHYHASPHDKRIDFYSSFAKINSSVTEFINRTAKDVKTKLLLTLTPRSTNFKLSNPNDTIGSMHEGSHKWQNLDFPQVCIRLKDNATFTRTVLPSQQNFATGNGQLVFYDDYESLRLKVDEIIFGHDLAGAVVMNVDFDDLFGNCKCGVAPYTRMVAELMKQSKCKFIPDCF